MEYGNFDNDLMTGLKYEKFIYKYFNERGVNIKPFGKEEQKRGENDKGLEIKCDLKLEFTGNLYVEYCDRADGGGGIFRENNTKFLLIGNYKKAYVFRIEVLRSMFRELEDWTDYSFLLAYGETEETIKSRLNPKFHRVNNNQTLSKGFLVSESEAEKYCLKVIKF